MTSSAAVARFPSMGNESALGARIKERRKSLGMPANRLAKEAEVSREHLSAVENGHKEPSAEWVRRVEMAMDRYAHMTDQDEPEQVDPAPGQVSPGFIRFKVEGVYGAKALIVEGPVDNLAELEAAVDRIMRRLSDGPTSE